MRPFYFKRKVKNLTCRNNYSTKYAKLLIFTLELLLLCKQNKNTPTDSVSTFKNIKCPLDGQVILVQHIKLVIST
jgi:hypothetical protein